MENEEWHDWNIINKVKLMRHLFRGCQNLEVWIEDSFILTFSMLTALTPDLYRYHDAKIMLNQ